MRKLAIGYVRVSSKDQEREGFSIPAQKELLRTYAVQNELRIIKIFSEAETAKKAGRGEFEKMKSFLLQNPNIHHVLVEKTDRLYRNFKDYVDLDIDQTEFKIHLIKEGVILSKDSKSSEKFVHGIKVLMAKNFIDNLSEEVKKGQGQKAKGGIWPSWAPLGYVNRLEDRTIQLDPIAGPLVKRGFEMAATGAYSLSKLKRELFKLGLLSKRAKKELGKQAMARILKSSFYYGEFSWGGNTIKGNHTPLITKDLFDRVQVAMGFVNKPRLKKHDFPFTGLMTCSSCGCAITAETKTKKKSGRQYTYYHCTNGKRDCNKVTWIRQEAIRDKFKEALRKIQLSPEIVE